MSDLLASLSAPLPQPITLDYELYARGSARFRICCGEHDFSISDFGSLTDGLGDFVRAALTVATGAGYAEILFDAEPQIWGLAVESAGLSDEKVRIVRISIKDGGRSLQSDGHSSLPVWKWSSEPVFQGFVTTDDFAREVQQAALKVRRELDDATYRETWGHFGSLEGFPQRGLAALEAALAITEYRE